MAKNRRFLCLIGIIVFAVSCTKMNSSSDNAYYVKYASDGFKNSNYEYTVTYTAEDGREVCLSDFEGGDFERTIGPVSKGFTAEYSIKSTSSQYVNHTIGLRIEVKKGNAPFVVKKDAVKESVGFDCKASLSYTVE